MDPGSLDYERTLRNLSILGRVKQNDKLTTLGETFSIHPPSTCRGLYRRWNGEYREQNISRVHEVVSTAFSILLQQRRAGYHGAADDGDGVHHISTRRIRAACERLTDALEQAQVGLHNLAHTYHDDVAASVRLTLLAGEIAALVDIVPRATLGVAAVSASCTSLDVSSATHSSSSVVGGDVSSSATLECAASNAAPTQ
jgi:hypothetical protein